MTSPTHAWRGNVTITDVGPPSGLEMSRPPSTVRTRCISPVSPLPPSARRAAAPVVGHPKAQQVTAPAVAAERGVPGAAVLDCVGQQFGGAEVRDGLDRRRRAGPGSSTSARPARCCGRRASRGRAAGRRRARAGGCRGRGRAARRAPRWRCGGRCRRAAHRARSRRRRPSSPSFSLAMSRLMARATSRACAPSCRSRSSRRSSAAESSTASALVSSRSRTRSSSLRGPSRARISQRSASPQPGEPRCGPTACRPDHDGEEGARERVDVQVAAEREGGDDRHARRIGGVRLWSNSTQRTGVVRLITALSHQPTA